MRSQLRLHILLVLLAIVCTSAAWADIQMTAYGAVGDGVTDDTVAVQTALTACSDASDRCVVPEGKTFAITNRLFMWGGASLYAVNKADGLTFNGDGTNLVNIGISALLTSASVWTGTISHLTFTVTGGSGGRILYFWRTNGGTVTDTAFNVDTFSYSATSSGNNQAYLANCESNAYSATNPCVRRNLTVTDNTITADATNLGSEGFGFGWFDQVTIDGNEIIGVGDDPIGLHFCSNSRVTNNTMSSSDGRLFVANSWNIYVAGNVVQRKPRPSTGTHYQGIALVYIGFETAGDNSYPPPENITVLGNRLSYAAGSIDLGTGIYLYGIRSSYIANNQVIKASTGDGPPVGLYLLPWMFTGTWTDPSGLDPTDTGRVHSNLISNNKLSNGLILQSTGSCDDYVGMVGVTRNSTDTDNLHCGLSNTGTYQPMSGDPAATRAVRIP